MIRRTISAPTRQTPRHGTTVVATDAVSRPVDLGRRAHRLQRRGRPGEPAAALGQDRRHRLWRHRHLEPVLLENANATGAQVAWRNVGSNVTFNSSGQLTSAQTINIPAVAVNGTTVGNIDVHARGHRPVAIRRQQRHVQVNVLQQDGFPAGSLHRCRSTTAAACRQLLQRPDGGAGRNHHRQLQRPQLAEAAQRRRLRGTDERVSRSTASGLGSSAPRWKAPIPTSPRNSPSSSSPSRPIRPTRA